MERPPLTQHNRRMRSKEPVAITITLDTALTVASCTGMVEDLVKYILYQRCQIPVPFDALEREVRVQRLHSQAHLRDLALPPHTPQGMTSRKEEIMKQKLQRKRQQWLNKVDKFLHNFNSMKESLRNELKSGKVRGINIILGSSVMTGRENYFIKLPEGYTNQPSSQLLKTHPTKLKLFRDLVTNEALLKVMNQPCGVQRIWIMVQKSSSPENTTDNITVPEGDTTAANLIPRPEYSQNLRATKVEINIQHTCVNASMDLTPTVGSGITLHNLGIKRSLYLNSPSIFQSYSQNMSQETLHRSFLGSLESDNVVSDSDKSKMLPPTLNRNLEFTYNRPILETPVKMVKRDVIPVVETPVHSSLHKMETFTPSKQLASQLGTFNLSDVLPDNVWYQVDCLISGFRDMCLKS